MKWDHDYCLIFCIFVLLFCPILCKTSDICEYCCVTEYNDVDADRSNRHCKHYSTTHCLNFASMFNQRQFQIFKGWWKGG